jgi:ferredoxin-like protein FixX
VKRKVVVVPKDLELKIKTCPSGCVYQVASFGRVMVNLVCVNCGTTKVRLKKRGESSATHRQ